MGLSLVNDQFEIDTLLEDYTKGESTLFFALNEIRNILIDQRSIHTQEELLYYTIKHLDPAHHKELLLNFSMTSSVTLNRLTLFALQDLIDTLSAKEKERLKKEILSPLYQLPRDTKLALSEFHLDFTLTGKELLELLNTHQWQKILIFEEEIASIDDAYIKEESSRFIQAGKNLDTQLRKEIHGEVIKLFEAKSISEVLRLNPFLAI